MVKWISVEDLLVWSYRVIRREFGVGECVAMGEEDREMYFHLQNLVKLRRLDGQVD